MAKKKNYEYVLPEGFVLRGGENDYVIEKVLGKGGFGVTYKVKASVLYMNIPIDAYFAVKEFFPDICSREADNATIKIPETKRQEIADGKKDFINEGKKLQEVCKLNPNIVNVNEVFQANGTAYYVLEYLEGGDLRKMVKNNGKPLTERQMLDVMLPIGHAVQCLHDNRMLHLDIKPDNIVMRRNNKGNDEPVLIDFGIAMHFYSDGTPSTNTPSQGITPGYSPIEQYSQVKKFDPRIDVYSFAATCFYLLTGKDPIEATDIPQDFVRRELPQGVSANVAAAIERGMAMNKNARIGTIDEVLQCFEKQKVEPVSEPEVSTVEPSFETIQLESPASKMQASIIVNDDPNATKISSAAVSPSRAGQRRSQHSAPDAKKSGEKDKDTPLPIDGKAKKLLIGVIIALGASLISFAWFGKEFLDSRELFVWRFFTMIVVSGAVGLVLKYLNKYVDKNQKPITSFLIKLLIGLLILSGFVFIPLCLERFGIYTIIILTLLAIFAIVGVVMLIMKYSFKSDDYNTASLIKLLRSILIIIVTWAIIIFVASRPEFD